MSRDPTIEFYHRESDAQRAEIDSLRAELAANNELYSIIRSDLAAVSLQYDAATAVIERLEIAARHDAGEIARLMEALARADVIIKWMAVDIGGMCPPEDGLSNLNKHWIFMEARAALASCPQGEVRVQAHGPFPGAPFSPPKGDK